MVPWLAMVRLAKGILLAIVWPLGALAQVFDEVEMRPGDFGDEAWFLEPFIAATWEDGYLPGNYVRDRNVWVGRFDLNDDGDKEIVLRVNSGYFCGSVGCPTFVFERQGDTWAEIDNGHFNGLVLTERVCGYRSLISRNGIGRWNGETYEFAYCFPWENQCRSLAIMSDSPAFTMLERFDPKNGLLASEDCPNPATAAKAPRGHVLSSTSRVVAEFSPWIAFERPLYRPDQVLDLLPGDHGADATFIESVIAQEFERAPFPETYVRARHIHIGRMDLNRDGTEELFVANYHGDACKSDRLVDGCPFLLFQREGGGWREIGEGRLRYAVFLLDETLDGYRSIRGSGESYRWNGDRYEAVRW